MTPARHIGMTKEIRDELTKVEERVGRLEGRAHRTVAGQPAIYKYLNGQQLRWQGDAYGRNRWLRQQRGVENADHPAGNIPTPKRG